MDSEMIEQMNQQAQIQTQKPANPPVIHSDPNALYEETCRRLEHYNAQIERLSAELKKLTIMRDVLAAAQIAFDKQSEKSETKASYLTDTPY